MEAEEEKERMQRKRRGLMIVILGYKILSLICVLMINGMVCRGQEAVLVKSGSVCIFMRLGEDEIPGGTLTLYQVGIYGGEGNSVLQVNDDFSEYEGILSEIYADYLRAVPNAFAAEYASELAEYVSAHNIPGVTADVGTDGSLKFANLQPGLYLLIQEDAAAGYQRTAPFLAAIPVAEEGRLVYDVVAYPKIDRVPETSTEETESGTEEAEVMSEESEEGTEKTEAASEKSEVTETYGDRSGTESIQKWLALPQTGQWKWPVPVLILLGTALIIAGRSMRKRKQ